MRALADDRGMRWIKWFGVATLLAAMPLGSACSTTSGLGSPFGSGGWPGSAGNTNTAPTCGQTCQDYLSGLAVADSIWLLYNQNVAGKPAGSVDQAGSCPLGGTVHVTGTTAVNAGVNTVHLVFDLAHCHNSASLYSLTFNGLVNVDGTFKGGADKFTAVTFSSATLALEGGLDFFDNPALDATCELAETQQGSGDTEELNGRLCGREFSSSTALKNPGTGSAGSGGTSAGSGGSGSAGGAGTGASPSSGVGGGSVTGGLGCPSIYDGTYIGQFAYDYTTDDPTPVTGTGAFNLTLVFECLVVSDGQATLRITHANATDPYFGCQVSGCALNEASVAQLPASPPTTPTSPSLAGQGIVLFFPNNTGLATENGSGDLSVTSDGRMLSNSLNGSTSTWSAAGSGAMSAFPDASRRVTSFKSWSLTKSAI
jgi:hypothetical protein